MVHSRIRYNAKARRSGAAPKKKKRSNLETKPSSDFDVDAPAHPDPNVTIHTPRTKEQRAKDKKERLRQEVPDLCIESLLVLVLTLKPLTLQLMATSNSKMTSKRKKRLDKYIVGELIPPTGKKAQKRRASCYTPETFVSHSTTVVLQTSDAQQTKSSRASFHTHAAIVIDPRHCHCINEQGQATKDGGQGG
jgi:hypothetical protein